VANNLVIDESRKAKEASLEMMLANAQITEPAVMRPLTWNANLIAKEVLATLHSLPGGGQKKFLILRLCGRSGLKGNRGSFRIKPTRFRCESTVGLGESP